MPPFLTKRALRESGLIVDADDRLLGTCPALPSFHLAYAREAEKMSNLMASVPDEPAPPRCQSCALVSNAGILRKREYGEAIDAHECVWRMNRAPTKGFEKHVGKKTTLDWVNSFPHLRNPRILPRLDSHLLHGMTIELWEGDKNAKDPGFAKYMGWVDGHVKFKTQVSPRHTVDVLDLAWLDNSWAAFWAYLAPFERPESKGRPSSGWHMTRLALQSCEKVSMYGFSMEADDFHYFDSLVQEKVLPQQRNPEYGFSHKFAREHQIFTNWSRSLPERFALYQ